MVSLFGSSKKEAQSKASNEVDSLIIDEAVPQSINVPGPTNVPQGQSVETTAEQVRANEHSDPTGGPPDTSNQPLPNTTPLKPSDWKSGTSDAAAGTSYSSNATSGPAYGDSSPGYGSTGRGADSKHSSHQQQQSTIHHAGSPNTSLNNPAGTTGAGVGAGATGANVAHGTHGTHGAQTGQPGTYTTQTITVQTVQPVSEQSNYGSQPTTGQAGYGSQPISGQAEHGTKHTSGQTGQAGYGSQPTSGQTGTYGTHQSSTSPTSSRNAGTGAAVGAGAAGAGLAADSKHPIERQAIDDAKTHGNKEHTSEDQSLTDKIKDKLHIGSSSKKDDKYET